MTEIKHSSAPWELNYSFFDKEGVYWEVEGQDGAHIAQNQFGGNTRVTELANARVISCAPEMLVLLLDASHMLAYGTYASENERKKLIARIEQVVDKANGDD
jgi:hypothetical protein